MSYLCGCYYHILATNFQTSYQKHYLPLLHSEVHSTILSTTSRTVLKQTFTNPSKDENIKECVYTFPLYDGVSVVSFTCRIGAKVLTGLVKEKDKAKEIFDQAVARGETAGYLEQAPESSDVFSTKLGNIPAGESVIVEITYIGELKHHENDGVRFTIPTKIAPRYGSGPSHGFSGAGNFGASGGDNGEIKIVIDIDMPEDSFIKGVQSPSHPIAVSMGTVSTATQNQPTMSKASATLSLGSAALDQDFVLIVQCKDVGIPKAILETHPTIPNHRALMATLVPKFSLPPSRSEIVFVADRSGSMRNNIEMLVSAMKVFLKSLPPSVKFNICSFGTKHSFLWEKSQSNSRETLEQAIKHLSTFASNMGGTQTFSAIKGTVEQRLTDIPLEIILLTDGDIHRQNELFVYVNEQVEKTKGNIRVFPLGIGNGVSHSLIEGLARAGNGFAQAVQQGERLDNAVVRMLRGALSPHITDYTLEVKYEAEMDDDFELIDRVTEGLKVLLTPDTVSLKSPPSSSPKATISLFDTTSESEKDALKEIQDAKFILPSVPSPKLLQAPHKIPSLFAFSRTSVYLLMSPETFQRNPIAVILRGTSEAGPLALEIPIETLAAPAETIHQLAAKKAVQDLEEGRGWIYDAKDQDGMLLKDRYPSCFDDMVQREAVRLGEKFQIAGKWCSFVAVEANDKEIAEKKSRAAESNSMDTEGVDEFVTEDFEDMGSLPIGSQDSFDSGTMRPSMHSARRQLPPLAARESAPANPPQARRVFRAMVPKRRSSTGFGASSGSSSPSAPPPPYPQSYSQPHSSPATLSMGASPFGTATPQHYEVQMMSAQQPMQAQEQGPSAFGTRSGRGGRGPSNLFGGMMAGQGGFQGGQGGGPPQQQQQQGLFGNSQPNPTSGGLFAASMQQPAPTPARKPYLHESRHNHAMRRPRDANGAIITNSNPSTSSPGGGLADAVKSMPEKKKKKSGNPFIDVEAEVDEDEMDVDTTPPVIDWSTKSVSDKVLALIDLQDFEGFWPVEKREEIAAIIGVKVEEKEGEDGKLWVTLFVVKFLEEKCGEEEGTWGLIVEKARGWIAGLGKQENE